MRASAARDHRVTTPQRRISWFPLEAGWPSRHWIGCETRIDGTRTFARVSTTGSAAYPPVVMLHGLVVSGSYFRPFARLLEGRLRLYIPDMSGFGRSATDGIHSLSEIVDLLNTWMAVHQLEQTVIVANSMGCQIATLLAVRYPHRVSRLVMVAPTMDPQINGPVGLMLRGLMDIPRERVGIWRIWIPDFLATGPVRALSSLFQALNDPQLQRMPNVFQPMLGVAGEHDPICPVSWVERYVGLARHGHIAVIPDAAHAMNFSAPEALARIVADLVENGDR